MQGGLNAFHMSAMGGHLAVAEYLVPKMKDHLFDTGDVGETALHWAAQNGHLSMVKYLVRSCGFDVKAVDKVCLLYIVYCLFNAFSDLSGHTRHLYLSYVNPLCFVSCSYDSSFCNVVCTCTPADVAHH